MDSKYTLSRGAFKVGKVSSKSWESVLDGLTRTTCGSFRRPLRRRSGPGWRAIVVCEHNLTCQRRFQLSSSVLLKCYSKAREFSPSFGSPLRNRLLNSSNLVCAPSLGRLGTCPFCSNLLIGGSSKRF